MSKMDILMNFGSLKVEADKMDIVVKVGLEDELLVYLENTIKIEAAFLEKILLFYFELEMVQEVLRNWLEVVD